MQHTTNYGLKKPELNDNVNINDFNENADIIDQKLKENENALAAHKADYATFKQQTESTIGTETLPTTAQTLKGAIAEVFTNGNNVKADTVGALLSVDDSLPITQEDNWQTIIDAIGQISTGKKWASGTLITTSGFPGKAEVSGLNFKPSTIIIFDTSFSITWSSVSGYSPEWYARTTLNSSGSIATFSKDHALVTESSFSIRVDLSDRSMNWIAYE